MTDQPLSEFNPEAAKEHFYQEAVNQRELTGGLLVGQGIHESVLLPTPQQTEFENRYLVVTKEGPRAVVFFHRNKDGRISPRITVNADATIGSHDGIEKQFKQVLEAGKAQSGMISESTSSIATPPFMRGAGVPEQSVPMNSGYYKTPDGKEGLVTSVKVVTESGSTRNIDVIAGDFGTVLRAYPPLLEKITLDEASQLVGLNKEARLKESYEASPRQLTDDVMQRF